MPKEKKDKTVECPTCKKTLSSKWVLKVHSRKKCPLLVKAERVAARQAYTAKQHLADLEAIGNTAYYELLQSSGLSPKPLLEYFEDVFAEGTTPAYELSRTYHLIANEVDIPFVTAIPELKYYAFTRCHLVADDGSVAHEHFHALVRFTSGTRSALRQRMTRNKTSFHRQSRFKVVNCFDHVLGVYRYICCGDGLKIARRGADGLYGSPHTHYCRSVYDAKLLHGRGVDCITCRSRLVDGVREFLSKQLMTATWKFGELDDDEVSGLHDFDTCLCSRGKVGLERRRAANQKRSDYYKTEEGKKMRKSYNEKAAKKRELIAGLSELKLNKKARLQREKLVTLVDLYL